MSRRPPGEQLSAGRLRVDAARAIAKLREYQLVDRHAWVLEAIRAAVASGARKIVLDGDANDLWLSWEGEPWPAEDLPRLFDELVSPEAVDERHHVRLLATAVNSALGLEPSYVDVFTIAAAGQGQRTRYTPAVLVPPREQLGESPLHRLAIEPAAPPRGARRGMAVHLRRRFGLQVLSYFLRKLPPELALAHEACRDLPVPLFLDGEELGRHRDEGDLVRVPLGADLDGFLAVCDVGEPRPLAHVDARHDHPLGHGSMALAERGVVLARVPLTTHVPPHHQQSPLRAFLDAPRMPSNAGRSQVRSDVHPVPAAHRCIAELWEELAARLVDKIATADPRARAAALRLFAATGALWRWDPPPGFAALGALPLVHNAVGEPRPLTQQWRPFAYEGKKPLPPTLEAWMDDVLWLPPGDASQCLVPLDERDAPSFERHLRTARAERDERQRFFASPRRLPVVDASSLAAPPRLRLRLGAALPDSCVDDAWFEGFTGELCILPPPPPARAAGAARPASRVPARRRGGELVLLLDGRVLERLELDSAIPFSAVVQSPAFSPEHYRAVVRDAVYERAERMLHAALVRAMEALALDERGEPVPDHGFAFGPAVPAISAEAHAHSLRAAISLVGQLGLALRGPLSRARAWLTPSDRWIDLEELAAGGPIFSTIAPEAPGDERHLPLGRLVVYATEQEHRELSRLAKARGLQAVRYGASSGVAHASLHQLAQNLLLFTQSVVLTLTTERHDVAISFSREPLLQVFYEDEPQFTSTRPSRLGTFAVYVNALAPLPTAQWSTLEEVVSPEELREWEEALLRSAALALLGRAPPELLGPFWATSALRAALGAAFTEEAPSALLGATLLEELRAAPLFPMLDGSQRSAAALAIEFPETLSYVPQGKPVEGLALLLAGPDEARLAARLGADQQLRDATAELTERAAAAELAHRLAEHRARPVVPVRFPDDVIQVPLESESVTGVVALNGELYDEPRDAPVTRAPAAMLPAASSPLWRRPFAIEVQFLLESRQLKLERYPLDLPLRAIVEVSSSELSPRPEANLDNLEWILRALRATAPRLLLAEVQRRPDALASAGLVRALLLGCSRRNSLDEATIAELAGLATFPTLQGDSRTVASSPGELRLASWQGEWLDYDEAFDPAPVAAAPVAAEVAPAEAGEAAAVAPAEAVEATAALVDPAAILGPVFLLAPGDRDLLVVFGLLHRAPPRDVTESLTKLQTRRRIARGLVARPQVPEVAHDLKRRLEDLGPVGLELAPGELALVDESCSQLLLHAGGQLRQRVRIPDILPAVHLALEAPALLAALDTLPLSERAQLNLTQDLPGSRALLSRAQQLTHELIRLVVSTTAPSALPPGLLPRLRRLVLNRRSSPPLAAAPIFPGVDGSWATEEMLAEQRERFGDVWVLVASTEDSPAPRPIRPLDDSRLVIWLTDEELRFSREHRWPFVEATLELALDAQARVQRDRPPAASLDLDLDLDLGRLGQLGRLTLAGDGLTAPRGEVAVLLPAHSERRGLRPHRQLQRFAPLADPCPWPTLANVDDARLTPDRTWRNVLAGEALDEVHAAVREASERILASLVRPPDEALAIEPITAATCERLRTLRESRAQLRGALWLTLPDAPFAGALAIHVGDRVQTFTSPGQHAAGLGGELWVYLPDQAGLQRAPLEAILTELCQLLDGALLARLLARPDLTEQQRELLVNVRLPDVPSRAKPGAAVPIPVIAHPFAAAFADFPEPPTPPAAASSASSDPGASGASASGAPASPTATPFFDPWATQRRQAAHLLGPLAQLLAHRLVDLGLTVQLAIAPGITTPMITLGESVILAGNHPHLLAIAAAATAGSPWQDSGLDALVAHIVSLLNLARDPNDISSTGNPGNPEVAALGKLLESTRDPI